MDHLWRSSSGPRYFVTIGSRTISAKRFDGHFRDELRGQSGFGSGFNHESELRRRLAHFHGGFGRRILRAVNDVSPMN